MFCFSVENLTLPHNVLQRQRHLIFVVVDVLSEVLAFFDPSNVRMTAVCFDYVIAQLLHERNNVRKDQEKDCKTSIIGKSCAIYIILIHTVQ